jgi:hypothetical protein
LLPHTGLLKRLGVVITAVELHAQAFYTQAKQLFFSAPHLKTDRGIHMVLNKKSDERIRQLEKSA